MPYLEKFTLPSDYTEIQFIRFENRTCNWTELENVRAYFDFFEQHRSEFLK